MEEELKYLDGLEARSIYIIREAYRHFKGNIAALVSWGKDSVTMLYLIRKAFFGKIPMPVLHIDTSYQQKEIYEFRDFLLKKWKFKLLIARNEKALKNGMNPNKGRFVCCTSLKTEALKQAIKKFKLKALFAAIRRDEHLIRAKERIASPRDKDFKWDYLHQPPELWEQFNVQLDETQTHFRIHPMLHWTELQIWEYIKKEKIPFNPLYLSGTRKQGFRYRSLGCEPCCVPIPSNAKTIDEIIEELRTTKIAERAGRVQDKEKAFMMAKLRALGYLVLFLIISTFIL
jgi:sulfate adenylyltransferase subunit 2